MSSYPLPNQSLYPYNGSMEKQPIPQPVQTFPNQDQPPPSFEQAMAGAPTAENFIPPYGANLDFNQMPPPDYCVQFGQPPIPSPSNYNAATPVSPAPMLPQVPYKPNIKKSDDGAHSHDSTLNNDSNALLNFFIQNCDAPRLSVVVEGYHMVTRTRTVTRQVDGRTVHSTETYTEKVVDFIREFDASHYVNSQGIIYSVPDDKGNFLSVAEMMQKYVYSTNKFKSIKLIKRPLWNFQELDQAIRGAIRSTGYPHHISVVFPMKNHKMEVTSDSTLQRMYEDPALRCLCFLSCLCIIFYPIYLVSREKIGGSALKADFTMKISERQWFQENYWNIVSLSKNGTYNAAVNGIINGLIPGTFHPGHM